LLLNCTFSVPSVVNASTKTLRYGMLKIAGDPSALADVECRKRPVAGKVTPLDGARADPVCLPAQAAFRLADMAGVVAIVSPSGSGSGRMQMRGARAPPLNFA
jgi:hypothetical protein